MRKIIKFIAIGSFLFFIGCGGGSTNSINENTEESLHYDGKVTAAKLDKESAVALISTITNLSVDAVSPSTSSNNKLLKTSVIQNKITRGSVSGTVDVTTIEIDAITTKIVAIFKEYRDEYSAETLTGKAIYIIKVYERERSFIESMEIDASLLRLKSTTTDITLDGSIKISDYDSERQTVTQNLLVKDNKRNKIFKYEDFITILDQNDRAISFKGKVYDSEEGYIIISTPVELSYSDNNNFADMGGVIVYEGKDSFIKERIAYNGRVRIEIDKGKDGSVDEFEVYNIQTMEIVENEAPIVEIKFPKEIFTNTNLSTVDVIAYDPDLDEFNTTYSWSVNNDIASNKLLLDNELFKKHDILELTVFCEDNRVGDKKSSKTSKNQKVLNSRPVITASFSKLSLTLGDTKTLEYTVTDEDNDTIEILWEHANGYSDSRLDEYLNYSDYSCQHAIEEYDTQHSIPFSDLTNYEQEDFLYLNCQEDFSYKIDANFITEKTFTAIKTGFFKHKLIVSDGDYNRSKRLASHIIQMNLIESQEYNHEDFTYNDTHSIYMEDMDGDGDKDLVYISNLYAFSDKVPQFVIEYRDGKTLVERVDYNVPNLTRFDIEDYYLYDFNDDDKLDVLFLYTNLNNTSDHTSYGIMYRKDDGTFSDIEKFTLANRHQNTFLVDKIVGSSNDIVLLGADNYSSSNKVYIYGKESNKTLGISLPIHLGSRGIPTEILSYDLDGNSKKDIIVVNKNFLNEGKLDFVCSVLSQDNTGEFSEKIYTLNLQKNLTLADYEAIQNVKIVNIDDKEAIWLVQSSQRIYFMKLEENGFTLLQTVDYEAGSRADEINIFDPVDINRDGKEDIVIALSQEYPFVHVLIQKDNLEFLSVQKYNFTREENSFNGHTSSVLGDIDNDGKQELFVTTGESNLSVLYFK